MPAFPSTIRAREPLRASGLIGAALPTLWAETAATPVDWDDLFATTGLFGIEFGPAAALAGTPVELEGFMTPPMTADAAYFVLSRSPLPNCPFCVPAASWPDDIVVVHLTTPGVDIDHPDRPITVRGTIDLGEADGPLPGLSSHARLLNAIWRPHEGA